jgi:hypothetical protein
MRGWGLGIMFSDEPNEQDLARELRAARSALDAATADIRALPGHAHFLASPDFDEVVVASHDQPIVYLASAVDTGFALVVIGPGVLPLQLPELTDDNVRAAAADYGAAYLAWRRDTSVGKSAWSAHLDNVCRWLWDAVVDPLVQALPGLSRVTIVPCGQLGVLPLQAAWCQADTVTGRRYALDALTISYAPSARAMRIVRESATVTAAHRLLSVVDPRPVRAAELPGTAWEAAAARQAFPDGEVLEREQATEAEVRAALSRVSILHFAGHGMSSLGDPLDSALILAGDQPLALREIFGLRLALRLVVLSACETAVAGPSLPDEVVSLPTGLLQAGAAGVIASQWAIGDTAAAMVIAAFYRFWRQEGRAPAEALKGAQQWVRDTTNGQKAEAFGDAYRRGGAGWLTEDAAAALHASVVWEEPEARAHAAIAAWGGFAHFGI